MNRHQYDSTYGQPQNHHLLRKRRQRRMMMMMMEGGYKSKSNKSMTTIKCILPMLILCLSIIMTITSLLWFHNQQTTTTTTTTTKIKKNRNNNNKRNNNMIIDSSSLITSHHNNTSIRPHYYLWNYVNDTEWCRRFTTSPPTSTTGGSQQQQSQSPGLIYIKIPKCASSTLVGINIRIAQKVGSRKQQQKSTSTTSFFSSSWFGNNNNNNNNNNQNDDDHFICDHTKLHGNYNEYLLEESRNIHKKSNLIWTMLRQPADRAISSYYHFEVSRRQVLPTTLKLKRYLQSQKNYQLMYIVDHPNPKQFIQDLINSKEEEQQRQSIIQTFVLNKYNFIGLVERMEESLAIMKLLFNLDTKDLIVLNAKKSNGYDDGRSNNGTCIKIESSPTSNNNNKPPNFDINQKNKKINTTYIQSYIDDEFKYPTNFDYMLYDIVNKSLDYTINKLGKLKVEREVEKIKRLQQLAESNCYNKAIFPCSSNGTKQTTKSSQDCYFYDSGCGYQCVDEILSSV